jgi:AcrR family transcriptional regulator
MALVINRKQQQSEQTKKKIADAARVLFTQRGFKATSIDDLVKVTGCSAGNIYYHFKSKEGLFLYLLDEWNRDWEEAWRAKASQFSTTIEKLHAMAEELALDQLNHPLSKAADEFFKGSEKASEVEEHIERIVNGYLEFNRRLLQEGIDSGELAQGESARLALVLDSLFSGLGQHSRRLGQMKTLAMYRLAMNVFLYGTVRQPTSIVS